ncbi:hydrogenase expression protein [Haloarcula taiwanensis]|uniref:Hydrogenase expression protein n=1 Tax=Haloarcula taiwanensis TaxID=1932004 RepID=A0A2H4ZYC1_9EURY|nr:MULTISPECIES: AIR synthase family protein [Haloarcula]AUG47417.1 hydrogenase expression protein [Haloarcula taiwanensis]RLM33912.1 hydrogenase expression protein [Haloarcula sp. Atlit-120R]RLM42516.1 hydrogenase expression protein [Haloarcula sp. Atlit-47R]
MSDLGKIDRELFDTVIYPELGADREDVTLGPTHGIDFGVIDVDGKALVTATDPLSVLPGLGFERAGRFALDVVLADVAVSGVPPSHLSVTFTLPPEMTDDELAAMWHGFAGRAEEVGVSVVTGHTARYSGVDYSWVGGATVLGVGSHDDVVRPDGARPGDKLVVGTGPAAEVTGLFARLFPAQIGLSPDRIATAQERLADTALVEDAMAAASAGNVTAMHDATEGGIVGAFIEMADGAGVRFDVDSDAMPVADGVDALCDALDIDPWHVSSCGTLLAAVDPADADNVVSALRDRGTPAAVVGEVSEGTGLYVDGTQRSHPGADPSWEAFARLQAAADGDPNSR